MTTLVNEMSGQQTPPVEPIAIIGMACRFAGDATNPSNLWNVLSKGRTGWSGNAGNRFKMDAFWHPKPDISGTFNTRGFHLLKQDPAVFDNDFFAINGVEAKAMDPHHRMMLEVAYETFEDAGIALEELEGSNTGVYCTGSPHDYDSMLSRDPESSPKYRFTGTGPSFTANRVSAHYAIHEACQALRAGDVDQVLVGGANLILDPERTAIMASLQVLSDHGRSYAFDEKANGYGRGEGVAAVMLKPLNVAQQNGDTIRAVIRGTAIGADGRTHGITMPSLDAYQKVIWKAYRQARLDPKDTPFVEAHGTATPMGDKVEAEAVAKIFCQGRMKDTELLLGSVKANLGHTELISGIASIIKGILMLENGMIPPNPTFTRAREDLQLTESGIRVPTKLQQWPEGLPRRVSINSNGYGGTPAHVILEVAPAQSPRSASVHRPLLVVLSHKRDQGLVAAAKKLRRFLSDIKPEQGKEYSFLGDLAFTLGTKRSHHSYKASFVVSSITELQDRLDRITTSVDHPTKSALRPKVQYVFTGQGAQWAGMGRDLIALYPVFARSIQASEREIIRLGGSWFLTTEITCHGDISRLSDAEFAQPCSTAIQIALVDLLESWGIRPDLVCGHSSGEIAAAYAAKHLTAQDAIKVAFLRGLMTKSKAPNISGAMLAVSVGDVRAREYVARVGEPIALACINSPSSVTLSGERAHLEILESQLKEEGIFTRFLDVDFAYHSPYMSHAAEGYQSLIQHIAPLPAGDTAIKMISSVTEEEIQPNELDASYWARSMISPVRFSGALSNILKRSTETPSDLNIVIELGPHPALRTPIMQVIGSTGLGSQAIYLSTLSRQKNAVATTLDLVGRLFLHGVNINHDMVNNPTQETPQKVLHDLPTYQWHHETSYWGMSRRSDAYRLRKFPRHDLLGLRTEDSVDVEPIWRNHLRHSELPWLKDHRIQGQILFPVAGYITMIVEALQQQSLTTGHTFRDRHIYFRQVSIQVPVVIAEDSEQIETLVQVRPASYSWKDNSEIWQEFRVFSLNGSESTEHCRGLVAVFEDTLQREDAGFGIHLFTDDSGHGNSAEALSWREVKLEQFYKELAAIGLEYSGPFTSMQTGRSRDLQGLSTIQIPDTGSGMPFSHQKTHLIHPATLDSCFHTAFLGMKASSELNSTCIIEWLDELHLSSNIASQPGSILTVEAQVCSHGTSRFKAEIIAMDPDNREGAAVLHAKGVSFVPLSDAPTDTKSSRTKAPFCRIQWSLDPTLSTSQDVLSHCLLKPPQILPDFRSTLDEYCRVIIRQTLDGLSTEDEQKIVDHRHQLLQWMRSQYVECTSNPDKELQSRIDASGVSGKLLSQLQPHLHDFLLGDIDALEILFQNDLADEIYSEDILLKICQEQLAKYVELANFKAPDMRILEIGGGTGGLTLPLAQALFGDADSDGRGTYVFTDISTAFFTRAKSKLGKLGSFLEYKKLDIEVSPEEQGFEPESFDLVVASNVLHATQIMDQTLVHIRKLLKPTGKIAIVEVTNPSLRFGFWGCLPGWWRGYKDDRDLSPLLSTAGWDKALKNAGFSGVDLEMKDICTHQHEFSTIISAKIQLEGIDSQDEVKIVTMDQENGVGRHLCEALQSKDASRTVSQAYLSDVLEPGGKFIFLLELTSNFLQSPSEQHWNNLRHIMSQAESILWVSCGGTVDCPEPSQGMISGLARSLRSENHEMKFVTLDLDPQSASDVRTAEDILRIFRGTIDSVTHEQPLLEWEFAIRGGKVLIPRLVHDSQIEDYVRDSISQYHPRLEAEVKPDRALVLRIGTPGILDSLYWIDSPSHSLALEPKQIRLEMHYTSLNFKDLMVAMGQLPGISTLIFEGSGIVKEVGEDVQGIYTPGQAVYAFHPHGLATTSNIGVEYVHPIPEGMDIESAAAVPVVYATALYALRDAARIQPGESVLIHSGAGAVGQAAIALAQYFGASEIFVTVGNPEKAEFIKQKFSIPDENIISSRSTDFSKQVRHRTNGRGVDVVLNSLSGDAIRQSCNALASFGRFVEIGKKDILSNARLEMRSLEKNITFAVVDLALLALERPSVVQGLVHTCLDLVHSSKTTPVSPIVTKPIGAIGDHFRDMQAGRHTGMLLVRIKSMGNMMVQPPRPKLAKLQSDSSYLIVGGTGEVGRATAKFLGQLGGGHVITLSRSGGDTKKMNTLAEELRRLNVDLTTIKGDVADPDTMAKVQTASGNRPLRGIIHAATPSTLGATVSKMTRKEWITSTRTKVTGTMNLTQYFGAELDFLILTSSLSGIVGIYGTSSYSAANTFQDAFARHHALRGLPVRSLDLGLITTGGVVADRPDAEEVMKLLFKHGIQITTMQEVLALINCAIQAPPVNDADDAQILCRVRRVDPQSHMDEESVERPDARFSHIWINPAPGEALDSRTQAPPGVQPILRATADPVAAIKFTLFAIKSKLSQLIAIPETELQDDRSIASYGVDSLISVELRNWIVTQLGAHVQMKEIMSSIPMAQVAEMLARRSRFVKTSIFEGKEGSK
ncbi:hypothetical protein N7520_009144 [Penicillium odoratum]|uniref:uncharacterized protein n=1 Tax=Penicillium odoratum TaxID=1167516 RepID=UPI002548898E|nr:uncharacterized protein N7520_009144 [Penicillium odoratum]KAJ5752227.1 hypothetical protein N7520_009144 [Penicillium odoratum]